MMNQSDKITFFAELMLTCHNLYLWQLDADFHLISCSCPEKDRESMETLFALESLEHHIREAFSHDNRPVILTNSMGLMWTAAASSAKAGLSPSFCFLGPYFVDDSSGAEIEHALRARNLSGSLISHALSLLHALPVISFSKAVEYSVMLHYTLTGDKISVSDLRYLDSGNMDLGNIGLGQAGIRKKSLSDKSHGNATDKRKSRGYASEAEKTPATPHGTYMREREMLQMVREGDLDAVEKISQMLNTGSVGKLAGTPSRQIKNTVLVGIVLFSRAAIEGGLSPELSMSLCDYYFRAVETSNSFSELTDINRTMQNDYVRRVHEIRVHSDYSSQTRDVNAYIDLHLEEPIRLTDMAASLGYAPYYLSRKYQKETGISISERIRSKRIERAKELLLGTVLPIQEISERLCFSSPSYFIENFRKSEDMTPAEYRSRHGSRM